VVRLIDYFFLPACIDNVKGEEIDPGISLYRTAIYFCRMLGARLELTFWHIEKLPVSCPASSLLCLNHEGHEKTVGNRQSAAGKQTCFQLFKHTNFLAEHRSW